MTSRPSGLLSRAPDPSTPRMYDEPGIRFGVGHAGLVGAVIVASVLHLDVTIGFVLVLAAAVVVGQGLGPVWRAGLGLSAWLLFTGFDENHFGTLTFAQSDLVRLGLLVAGCLVLEGLATRRVTQ